MVPPDNCTRSAMATVGKGERGPAGAERLGQRYRDDHARVPRNGIEDPAPAVDPAPSETVGIIEVGVQIVVSVDQIHDLGHRRDVAEHRIDAIGDVPDLVEAAACVLHRCRQDLHVVVRDGVDRYALSHQDLSREVHSRVSLGVNDDGIALSDQDREGGQVPEGRRRWHDDMGVEDSPETLFEFGVQRQPRCKPWTRRTPVRSGRWRPWRPALSLGSVLSPMYAQEPKFTRRRPPIVSQAPSRLRSSTRRAERPRCFDALKFRSNSVSSRSCREALPDRMREPSY